MSEVYRHYFASVYDRLMKDMPYERWRSFVYEAWERSGLQPSMIVDLGCGTGSNSIAFAQAGFQVRGIDRSEDMLAIARDKASSIHRTAHVDWLAQDMREWTVGHPVDSVVCLCDGINYLLEAQDVKDTFRATYNGLKQGGLFLFDVLTEQQYIDYADGQPYTYDEEDIAYMWYAEWQEQERIITHDLTIFTRIDEDKEYFVRFQETHRQRAYGTLELREWLKEIGFSNVELFADFTWDEATDGANRVFVCARR